MDTVRRLVFWTKDFTDAAAARQAAVLLCNLDDPAFLPLTRLAPTNDDFLRAEHYGTAMRQLFFARRSLLRHLFARKLGCAAEAVVVSADSSGAPRLASPNRPGLEWHLSISHRNRATAFAIAPWPIGVDIEILGKAEALPAAMLHKAEAARLACLDDTVQHQAFLEIWTLKEAYLKALKTGLSREPADIEVRLEDGRAHLFDHKAQVMTEGCEYRKETLGPSTVIAACVIL